MKINKVPITKKQEPIVLLESLQLSDLQNDRYNFDPTIMHHISYNDVKGLCSSKNIAYEFPATTVVFDLAGSSLSIRNNGAIEFAEKTQKIFNDLTTIIYAHNGIVEKFPGDGISMHFPKFDEEDIQSSIQRAFEAVDKMDTYLITEANLCRGQFRFALTYGEDTVVTQFGNSKHKELITIGHAVNIAHKLEKLIKDNHCSIGFDETCYKYISPHCSCIPDFDLDSNLWRDSNCSEKWYGWR